MNKIILSLIIVTFLAILIYCLHIASKKNIAKTPLIIEEDEEVIPKLTFSNTQKWHSSYLNLANNVTPYQLDIVDKFDMKNMNYPSDEETNEEIEELLILEKNRTQQDIENINYELKLKNVISRFTDNKMLQKNLTSLIEEYMKLVYYLKKYYDRVRPSYYDKSIKIGVGIPLHASYPSGHASQAYFIANYMSYVDPSKKEFYYDVANQTAKNREIGDVHYKSDTDFGKYIADKYFEQLKHDGYITNEPSNNDY